jgi:hypothetical protein
MSINSQLFGLASAVAYIRQGGGTTAKNIIQGMSNAFGGTNDDGTYAYNLFQADTGILYTNGFNLSYISYANLENTVSPLVGNIPVLNVGISALTYGYGNYYSIGESNIVNYINKFNTAMGYPNISITESDFDIIFSSLSLEGINNDVINSPDSANPIGKNVNYNWYDSSVLFGLDKSTSHATLIKDIENQYYYLTGKLIYDPIPGDLVKCISSGTLINTSSGVIFTNYILNQPCYDADSYIGPVSGINFFRTFNDGPGTSGYFDDTVTQEYVNFDKAILAKEDYSSNNRALYSYQTDENGNYLFLKSGVNIDVPGVFNPSEEYGAGHTNKISAGQYCSFTGYYAEGVPLMRMHQGDNQLKWNVQKSYVGDYPNGICVITSSLENWTGWKLVNFELDESQSEYFQNVLTNPDANLKRFLKRCLSLTNSKDSHGNPVTPYSLVYEYNTGVLACYGPYNAPTDELGHLIPTYVGPPQLNGSADLPGLAFYQTFDNSNFPDSGGEYITINIRPVISSSSAGSINGDSTRTFSSSVSNSNLFSLSGSSHAGLNAAKLSFNKKIDSSGLSGYDDIFKKCLSIGDNFQNSISGALYPQSNAGFNYSGGIYFSGNEIVYPQDLLHLSKLIGSEYSGVMFLTGFQNINDNSVSLINRYDSQFYTGNVSNGAKTAGENVGYYYFQDTILGASNAGWESFSPIPPDVQNDADNLPYLSGIYSGISLTSKVENYLPRYYSGPYRSYSIKFLYPNASGATITYDSKLNGFPYKITYSMTIKEESVREVYGLSGLYSSQQNLYPIRANAFGGTSALNELMPTMFLSPYTYNFNVNKSIYPDSGGFNHSASYGGFVNGFYVPNFRNNINDPYNAPNYCTQSFLNSNAYQDSCSFINGIKTTGKVNYKVIYTGGGLTKKIGFIEPALDSTLFWNYSSNKITGEAFYVPPVFDLSTYTINPSQNLLDMTVNRLFGKKTDPTFSNNGLVRTGILVDGFDPIFYEYVGGRIGSGANNEGGYNSKNIIGDQWLDFYAKNWGVYNAPNCPNYGTHEERLAKNDNYLILSSFTNSGLNIYARGLNYYPYFSNWTYTKMNGLGNIGVTTSQINLNGESYYNFDLQNIFPTKTVPLSGQFYSSGGFNLGPFPQDVELCVSGADSIIPSGYLFVDGEQMTFNYLGNCPINNMENFVPNSGIITSQAGRGSLLTTFKLIPSGSFVNLNIKSFTSIGSGLIGITGKSTVTIRPRTLLGAVNTDNYDDYGYPFISGDYLANMNASNYINNGSESIFSANLSQFTDLIGQNISKQTPVRSEIIFPVPGPDFIPYLSGLGLVTSDANGNYVFTTTRGPTYDYWVNKNPYALFTGIRESTRLSIQIDNISLDYSPVPYQSYKNIIVSGACTISGEFSYTGQAESAILSQGIVLSGWTGSGYSAAVLRDISAPIYVSDILSRLPGNLLPSGQGINYLLEAPSLMKKRKRFFQITGGDTYIDAPPPGVTNYNKFAWPALSDLATLNPNIVYEQLPPEDGFIFPTDNLIFSASQGQAILTGATSGTKFNPVENVTYQAILNYAFLDSTATNSLYNSGKCIFPFTEGSNIINSGNLTGVLVQERTPLAVYINFV